MGLLSLLLDVVFPKECLGCGAFGCYLCSDCVTRIHWKQNYICPGCMQELSHFGIHTRCKKQSALDGLFAVSNYDGILRRFIGAVKYRYIFDMATIGGDLLYWRGTTLGLWKAYSVQTTAIVPVPLHWKKKWERGFNPSQLYADRLAKNLGLYMLPTLLRKTRKTRPQAQLSRAKRLKNVQNSVRVSVSDPKLLPPTVILIDDVATTGSTLQECAHALKKAGVKTVVAMVLAHGQ